MVVGMLLIVCRCGVVMVFVWLCGLDCCYLVGGEKEVFVLMWRILCVVSCLVCNVWWVWYVMLIVCIIWCLRCWDDVVRNGLMWMDVYWG